MALSEEAIKHQIDVLTTKTSENPDMVYKSIAALNKALDPEYFSGNDSKIVNAINKLAKEVDVLNKAFVNLAEKTSSAILDIYSEENLEIWEETKELMGEDTIIEGMKAILDGSRQEKMLQLDIADEGKILSVSVNELGRPEVKPISMEAIDVEVSAYNVAYLNRDFKGLTSVGEAIDLILEKMNPIEVEWENIVNKPTFANNLVLEEDALILQAGDERLSSVPLITAEDINNIILSLDM